MTTPDSADILAKARASGSLMDENDKVICCECGARYGQLSVHLGSRHKMSVTDYNAKWPGAPTISAWVSANVSAAQKGTQKGSGVPLPFPAPEPEPVTTFADAKAPPKLQPKEWLKIGASEVPVWEGWPEADQAAVPPHDKHYQLDVDFVSHIAVGLELIENVMITGPTGVGKTTALYELAVILNWPVTRINLNGETRVGDLIGDMKVIIDEGSGQAITTWQDGPLVTAMRRGHICLVDELDAAPPAVHFVMQRVTERDPDPQAAIKAGRSHVQLLLPTGEIIGAHPNFRLVSTANTVGTGDMTGDYAATHPLNRAFLSRWGVKLRVGYPKAEQWKAILTTKTGIALAKATQIVQVAEKLNEAKAKMTCRVSLGPRETLVWARLAVKLGNMGLAARLSIVNGIDPADTDHQFTLDVIKQVIGTI
jgi:cobaltochelatase CobS